MFSLRHSLFFGIPLFTRSFHAPVPLNVITLASDGQEKKLPLIMIHGLLGSGMNWRTIARQAQKDPSWKRDVFSVDLRNHGESSHHETMSLQEMVQDILHVMDSHNIPRASVLGHSLGGRVAMGVALTAPQRVERLVVADIAPVNYVPAAMSQVQGVVQVMQAMPLQEMRTRKDAEAWLEQHIPDASLRLFVMTNLKTVPQHGNPLGVQRWRLNLAAIAKFMNEVAAFPFTGPVQVPTLMLYGTRSQYVQPQEHEPLVRALFPAAQFVGLDAGHWLHADRPREFVRELVSFMA